MTEEGPRSPGKTTVAPDVMINIAALTTLSIDGVSRMSANPSSVNRLLQRGQFSDGVRVIIENNTVNADIHVILKSDVNIRQVSRNIQQGVARAISEMVGMEVGKINIHIEDIDYQEA
jgi:uncharacterized alkaline shock family protein YloU